MTEHLLIAFHSTTDALRSEALLQEAQLPGRLIPLPARIRAACGVGWLTAPACRARTEALLLSAGISPSGFYPYQTRS